MLRRKLNYFWYREQARISPTGLPKRGPCDVINMSPDNIFTTEMTYSYSDGKSRAKWLKAAILQLRLPGFTSWSGHHHWLCDLRGLLTSLCLFHHLSNGHNCMLGGLSGFIVHVRVIRMVKCGAKNLTDLFSSAFDR